MANGDWSTPDPPTCDVGVIKLKPNPNLVEDFDAVIPFRHRTTDGHIAFGRTIPPPNWERNHFLRSAAGSGAAYRDDDGELRVLVRSWIASTHSTLILPHRDVTIRGQLMHELEVRIRRAWPDQISPLDTLRLTTVRPTPNVGYHAGATSLTCARGVEPSSSQPSAPDTYRPPRNRPTTVPHRTLSGCRCLLQRRLGLRRYIESAPRHAEPNRC